jgi:hypothetical protein
MRGRTIEERLAAVEAKLADMPSAPPTVRREPSVTWEWVRRVVLSTGVVLALLAMLWVAIVEVIEEMRLNEECAYHCAAAGSVPGTVPGTCVSHTPLGSICERPSGLRFTVPRRGR